MIRSLQNVEQPELDESTATVALTYRFISLRVKDLSHERLAKGNYFTSLHCKEYPFIVNIVFGTCQVVVIVAKAVTWVTLLIIEAGPILDLIGH